MEAQFKAISLSHHHSPLALRESITLNQAEVMRFYIELKEILGIHEAYILSTCNRTEVYYLSEAEKSAEILVLLSTLKAVDLAQLKAYVIVENDALKAANYFLEVCAGLHSKVIGDMQLPNQIKTAYQWCADAQMAGTFLHRLLHTVFFMNKRIHQETEFKDGAASTSYAAVDTMESFLPLLNQPKILVVGLGELGRDVVKTLRDKGYANFTLCNRTLERSLKFKKDLGCAILPYEELETGLNDFEIIISSVQSNEPIIQPAQLKADKIRYFIDLSMPRSVHPEVQYIHGTVLYDLEEIQTRANAALQKRQDAIPHVKQILAETLEEFKNWNAQMQVSPTIQKLKQALEQIRTEEMARYVRELSEEEVKKVDKITSSMIQKVMKLPVLQLKAACKRGEAETLIDVLNDLFDLEKVKIS